jgi:hypothetical protein
MRVHVRLLPLNALVTWKREHFCGVVRAGDVARE